MYWLAIPLNTTPVTYQLINKANKQCMYKLPGTGPVGFRDCIGGAEEQWFFGSSDPYIRKRDNGVTGTLRYLCGKGTSTNSSRGRVQVESGCGNNYWGDIRWR